MSSTSNWTEITTSEFAWEREALEHIRARFPRHAPYRAWSNFEFLDTGGRLYEVDLLLCGPKGLFLVEIKSWPGQIAGDSHTLVWTDPDGRIRRRDHPLRLANAKAKGLKSQLERTGALRQRRQTMPFVSAAVFLSDPGVRVELDEVARTGLFGRPTDDQ